MPTKTPTKTGYTPQQKKLVDRLQKISLRMISTRDRLGELTDERRRLLIEAYEAGIDTVQLGRVIGATAETVRKNLEQLGSLRARPQNKEANP